MTTFKSLTFSVVAVTLASASAANAQQTVTLAEATRRALARNHDIRIERESVAASAATMERALGEYDPQFTLEVGARRQADPATSLFSGAPEGKVAASLHGISSSASMTQLFRSGAVGAITASTARDTTNGLLTLYAPAYTTSLGVELRQPLLRRRAIDPARATLWITALDRDRSSANLDRRVLDTVAEVEKAYWTLAAARRELAVRRATVTLAEQQRADTQVRVEARTVAPADLAEPTAELERRRGDLFIAEEKVLRAERALKLQMLGDGDADWAIELVPGDTAETPTQSIDLPRALAQAMEARPELDELASEIKQREVEIASARDDLKPSVDVFVSYVARGLSGERNDRALAFPGVSSTIPSSLNGDLGTSWQALLNGRFTNASAGLTIDIPVGNHSARGDVARAAAERRKTETKLQQARMHIETEVRNASTAVETAARRIEAAAAGLRAAEAQLRAEQDRFAAGATTSFFVLTRQTELTTAQLAQIAAVTDYRSALTELGRATGRLLSERGVQLDDDY